MKHTLGADKAVRKSADRANFSPEHDNLKAMLLVDVDVHRGHDVMGVIVLERCQTRGERSGVVVVDDGHRPYSDDVFGELGLDEIVADQIAECLGTITDSTIGQEAVKSLEEVIVNGDSYSYYVAHFFASIREPRPL